MTRIRFSIIPILIVLLAAVFVNSCGDAGVIHPKTLPSWIRTYGGTASEVLTSAQLVGDDQLILCGYVATPGNNNDIFVIKTDKNGNVEWAKHFGAAGNDQPTCVAAAGDGGFVIAGHTTSFNAQGFDIFVLYLKPDGSIFWGSIYNSPGDDYAVSVQQADNADIVVAGYANASPGLPNDIVVMRINYYGSVQWSRTYGGSENDFASSIRVTPALGGYILSGHTFSFGSLGGDILIMKLPVDGSTVSWAKKYGGEDLDKANSIELGQADRYLVVGLTRSFGLGPSDDALAMQLDANGNYAEPTWSVRTFGDAAVGSEAVSLLQEGGGKVYITGNMSSDIFVIRLFAYDMQFEWEKKYGGDIASYIGIRHDGTLIVAGTSAALGSNDVRILSLQIDGTTCRETPDMNPGQGNPTVSMLPVPVFPSVGSYPLTLNIAAFTDEPLNHAVSVECGQ